MRNGVQKTFPNPLSEEMVAPGFVSKLVPEPADRGPPPFPRGIPSGIQHLLSCMCSVRGIQFPALHHSPLAALGEQAAHMPERTELIGL